MNAAALRGAAFALCACGAVSTLAQARGRSLAAPLEFSAATGGVARLGAGAAAGSLRFLAGAGSFRVEAPSLDLGGSAEQGAADGWILEPLFHAGEIVNESGRAQTIAARLRLGWDSATRAENGAITLSGGVSGAGAALAKSGDGALRFTGGEIALRRLDLLGGGVEFSDCDARLGAAVAGGAPNLSISFLDGAIVRAADLWLGVDGATNRALVSGAAAGVAVDGELRVGESGRRGGAEGNSLALGGGAFLAAAGKLLVGASGKNGGEARGNSVSVSGGARLESAGALVGAADGGDCVENSVALSGDGAVWDAMGGALLIGFGENARAAGASLTLESGAELRGAHGVTCGAGDYGHAIGCRIAVRDGARVFSTHSVNVGHAMRPHRRARVSGNSVEVGGGARPSLWDMGGGVLQIAPVSRMSAASVSNRFAVLPGGEVRGCSIIAIGQREGCGGGNALALCGGSITAENLIVRSGNGIAVEIGAAGVRPLLLTGGAFFEEGVFIAPTALPGAAAGRVSVLGWNGHARGLQNLRLAEGADPARWRLEINHSYKRVFLHCAAPDDAPDSVP